MKLLSCDSGCSEDRSVTKTCTLTILLEQHRCMLQLHSRQPHVLRTVKTHKQSQTLHFNLTFTVAFYFGYFVFSLAIDFYQWYISMNTVSQQPWSNETRNISWTPLNASLRDKSKWYAVFPIRSTTMNGPTKRSLNFLLPCRRRFFVDRETLSPTAYSTCLRWVSVYFF